MSTGLKNLITNLVKEVLILEKLRGGFNLGEFKQLSKTASSSELLKYASERLGPPIGTGSSRTVFVLSSNKVLKLAVDQHWTKEGAGQAQNEAEVEVATNPKVRNVVARVLDYDSNFKWIISELTKPITAKEIEHVLGIDVGLFSDLLQRIYLSKTFSKNVFDEAVRYLFDYYGKQLTWYDEEYIVADLRRRQAALSNINADILKPVVTGILAMKTEFGFDVQDLMSHGHYGKTADGRLVVIDYGYTKNIGRKFYGR